MSRRDVAWKLRAGKITAGSRNVRLWRCVIFAKRNFYVPRFVCGKHHDAYHSIVKFSIPWYLLVHNHYCDVIMGAITSQITSVTTIYSTVHSDADQRKNQSSASLAFVRGIHRRPVNSPHKCPVMRWMIPFDNGIMVTPVVAWLTSHWTPNVEYNELHAWKNGPVTREMFPCHDFFMPCDVNYNVQCHDDVIKWKHFPRYWPFVRGIHRSRWIPHTKASDAEPLMFCLFAPE